MKKIIVFALALVLLFSFVSCDKEDVKANEKPNTDAVSGITEEEKEPKVPTPDEEYVLWKETSTKTNVERIYEYNDKGHLTRVWHNYPDGRVEEDLYEYTYNADGSYTVHEDGYLLSEKTSEYDTEGRLIKTTDSRYTTIYTYAGNTVECKATNDNGAITTWYVNTLDDDGKVIKREDFFANGKSSGYLLYIYDEKGNETAQEKYTPEGEKNGGNAVYVWTEEYDDYGRVIEKTKNIPETGGYARKELYEYDEKGGMCKMTVGISVYEYRPLSECIVKN